MMSGAVAKVTTNVVTSSVRVTRTALTRSSSVDRISRVSACPKSTDSADRCSLALLLQIDIAGAPNDAGHTASIERAAEAGHGDGHRQQHQCNQCNRVVLQVLQLGALQH